MREFNPRPRPSRQIYSFLSLAVLLVAVVVLGRATIKAFLREREAEEAVLMTERRLEELKENEAALIKRTAELKTPEGLEREIRRQLPVSREGEEVVVIVEEKETPPPVTAPAREKFWLRFLRFLGLR